MQNWKTFVLTIFLAVAPVCSQTPLTNDAVLKMVKAGLAEDVIVSMIRSQPASFSVSPETLIELKGAGVSDRVVSAMVERAGAVGSPYVGARTGATPGAGGTAGNPDDPLSPHDSGIYLYAKDRNGEYRLTVLEQAASQGMKSAGMWKVIATQGIAKGSMNAVIPGQHASIRSPDALPVFYFYFEDKAAGLGKGYFGAGAISNPSQFVLLKLEVTKSNRETKVIESGAFSSRVGSDQKKMIGFKTDRLKPGLYKVVPVTPLEPGEYCFLSSLSGAGAVGATQMFDFGVSQEK